jgi:structural maintenance of chromosome 4
MQKEKLEVESKLNPYSEKINSLKSEIEKNIESIKSLEERFQNSNKETEILLGKKNDISNEVNRMNKFVSDIDEKLTNVQVKIKEFKRISDKINADLEGKTIQVNTFINKISEIKTSNQEKQQRNNILDNLIKAQNEGRIKGIYGRLGDLGTIDLKYDVAITTACAALDNIVVESVDIGQKCVEFLRKNNLGRATFICLDKISWVESKINEHREKIPNAERLFDLVKVKNSKLANAFYFALRDTLVASDLKTATSIAYGSVRRRVVTISGELIEASGVMSGGGKPRKGGMSNKSSEEYNPDYINKLNNDYDELVKEIHKLKADKESLESQFNNSNKEYNDLTLAKRKMEFELVSNEKVMKEVEKNMALNEINRKKQKDEEKKVEEMKKINKEMENEIISSEKSSKSLREKLQKLEIAIAKVSGEEFLVKKEELKQLKKKVDEKDKEVNLMKNSVSNADFTLKKTKEEIILKEKTILELEDVLKNVVIELQEIEEKALLVYEAISKSKLESEELGKEFDEKKKEVEELKIVIRKMKEEQDKIKEEINEYKIEIGKLTKNENFIYEESMKIKKSYKNLIEEFGFIDTIEKEIKEIKNKSKETPHRDPETKDDDDDYDEEESQKSQFSKRKFNSKTKKISNHQYSKYENPIYFEKGFSSEELEELSSGKQDINYESLLIENGLKQKQYNLDAIKTYKKKVKFG